MKENKEKASDNYQNTCEFLKAAISDLAGNLNLIDTKISIVMATAGVLLGLAIACKSNFLSAFHFYSGNYFLKAVFISLTVTYSVVVLLTYIFGINCIMIRFGKSKRPSLWFFETEEYGGVGEKNYIQKIKQMNDEGIVENLSVEVFKLNTINHAKMLAGRKTLICFSISSAILFSITIMASISYLIR